MDKRKWNGARCALLFHSEEFFGLARSDYNTVHGKEVSAWQPPNKQTIERNERRIKNFQNVIKDEEALGECEGKNICEMWECTSCTEE